MGILPGSASGELIDSDPWTDPQPAPSQAVILPVSAATTPIPYGLSVKDGLKASSTFRWAKNLAIGVCMGFVVLGRSFMRGGISAGGLLLLAGVAVFTAFILDATRKPDQP
jgi:hypothetical protein